MLPMPPRGPMDMLLGRNCAWEAVVAAATAITANAVEIDKRPISLKRRLDERMAVSPRSIFNSRSAPYSCDAFMASPCQPSQAQAGDGLKLRVLLRRRHREADHRIGRKLLDHRAKL